MSTKRYNFKFHCTKDSEIIARLDAQENKQNYIRSLILSDIAADVLRDAFKLGDTHAIHEPVTHDVESFEPCVMDCSNCASDVKEACNNGSMG